MKNLPAFLCLLVIWSAWSGCHPQANPPVNTDQPPNAWGMTFQLYSSQSIHEPDGAYTAGNISDMIEMNSGAVLACSPASGVWYIDHTLTVSLSKDWVNPNMRCLARGPRGRYYCAGGFTNALSNAPGALYISDTATVIADYPGAFSHRWHPISIPGIARINAMLFDTLHSKFYLATENGIWVSPIPEAGNFGGFVFTQATYAGGLTTPSIRNILQTGTNKILASGVSGCYAMQYDASGGLTPFQNVNYDTGPGGFSMMYIGQCAAKPDSVYLWIIAPDQMSSGGLYLSGDGGLNFNRLSPQYTVPGNPSINFYNAPNGRNSVEQDFDGSVAVDAQNPGMVVLGLNWVYVSVDYGRNFYQPNIPKLHQDVHHFHFSDYTPHRLYNCSDGGLVYSDLASPAAIISGSVIAKNSFYNMHLPNLLCLTPTGQRQYWGNISIVGNGFLASGLMDNDDVVLKGRDSSWRYIMNSDSRGDGGGVGFTGKGILSTVPNANLQYRAYSLLHGFFQDQQNTIPIAGSTNTVAGIFAPYGDGQIDLSSPAQADLPALLAVAQQNGTNQFMGIYADAYTGANARARNLFACPFRTTPGVTTGPTEYASCIYVAKDSDIYIGTRSGGRIFKAARQADGRYTVSLSNLGRDQGNNLVHIPKIYPCKQNHVVAILNDSAAQGNVWYEDTPNHFVPRNGNLPAAGGMIFSVVADTAGPVQRVFITLDDGVYATQDIQDSAPSWIKVSTGLPTMPHCSDLTIGNDWTGRRTLFLSTWGWSVWYAYL